MNKPAPAAPPDSLATLSDHLGRLLAHADRLLDEWKDHADSLRARFDAEARAAGETLHRSLEGALTEASVTTATALQRALGANAQALRDHLATAQKAAAELETGLRRTAGTAAKGGGLVGSDDRLAQLTRDLAALREDLAAAQGVAPRRRASGRDPARLTLILAVSANVLVLGVLAVVLLRGGGTPGPAPAPREPEVVARPPDAGAPEPLVIIPDPERTVPCSALALSGATAADAIEQCLDHICKNPDGKSKPSLPDDCTFTPRDKKTKVSRLSCVVKGPPGNRTLSVEWPGDCGGQ